MPEPGTGALTEFGRAMIRLQDELIAGIRQTVPGALSRLPMPDRWPPAMPPLRLGDTTVTWWTGDRHPDAVVQAVVDDARRRRDERAVAWRTVSEQIQAANRTGGYPHHSPFYGRRPR